MSRPITTDLAQLEATAAKTKAALAPIAGHTKTLQGAIDMVNSWRGDAKQAFLEMMGINLPELQRLNTSLETMATNLSTTHQGVTSGEAEAVKALNAATHGSALSGAPLNQPGN